MIVRIFSSLLLVSLVAFLWPLLQEYGELSLLDFSYACAVFLSVMVIQCLVIFLLYAFLSFLYFVKEALIKTSSRLYGKKHFLEFVLYFITSLLISHNIYHFLFTLMSLRQDLETLISISFMPLLYFLMKSKKRMKLLYIFCSVFLALSFINFAADFFSQRKINSESAPAWDLSRFDELDELKRRHNKRNIYLISFDAVASPESLRRFYDIESDVHIDYLKNSGFRVLDSSFSGGPKTRLNFFNMMSLGEQARMVPAFFATRNLNPSYVLFEKVGYKVQFLFGSNYMGSNTNTLDYFFPEKSFITLCDFIDPAYAYIACNYTVLYDIVRANFGSEVRVSSDDFFLKVLERIGTINMEGGSWVSFAHIWFPGHAPLDFVYTNLDEKQRFIKKTVDAYPRLKDMIVEVVNTINESDPDPIIIIYSDHGAWLTQGLDYNQENDMYSSKDIYLEKNGVLFSIYPSSFCEEVFQDGYNTANLIPDMLKCELDER